MKGLCPMFCLCIISTFITLATCLRVDPITNIKPSIYKDRPTCNSTFDKVYERELAPRLGFDQHYMDYTGSSLYLNAQVAALKDHLQSAVYGNPHSFNPSSQRTTLVVESLRRDILKFYNADPEKYILVFTRSATGGLQMLGESFPWSSNSRMAYLKSNHNSVVGIREYALQGGADIGSISEQEVEAWLNDDNNNVAQSSTTSSSSSIPSILRNNNKTTTQSSSQSSTQTYSLFAYPAQDNYAGVLYPLDWVSKIQSKSTSSHRWLVLLDVAAYVPTHRLDLEATPADFICVSFYKMFGLPTGAGAWIMPKEIASTVLQRTYWAGGSAFTATSRLHWEARKDGAEHWEDGTLPFLDILALKEGFAQMEQLGGITSIENHVSCVKRYLGQRLADLKHSNGQPMIRLFGKHFVDDGKHQGGAANFHVLKPDGSIFSYKLASVELADAGFHVREGCMCNPGACYEAVGVTDEELKEYADSKHGDYSDWEWITVKRDGKDVALALGSIRVSLGWMSRVADVDALADFISETYKDRMDDGGGGVLLNRLERRRGGRHWHYGC